MGSTLLVFSRTEIPAQIQGNLIAYMKLFAGLPGMHMHDADSFWFYETQPAPGDAIFRANWTSENVEERIDATLAAIGQHLAEGNWMVFPATSRPIWAAAGGPGDAQRPGRTGCGRIWGRCARVRPRRRASGRASARRPWHGRVDSHLGGGVWRRPPLFYDAYARHGYGPDVFSLHYTGYVDDVPVTSATLLERAARQPSTTCPRRRPCAGKGSAAPSRTAHADYS